MVCKADVQSVLDRCFCEMAKWAHLEIERTCVQTQLIRSGELVSLKLDIFGFLQMTLIWQAERSFFYALANGMSRRPLSDWEDVQDYIKEFYNVVVGRFVAAFNEKKEGPPLTFGIPWCSNARTEECPDAHDFYMCYSSNEGATYLFGDYSKR